MPMSYVNPYSGEPEETCSVSFGVQQQVFGDTGSAQTEAQYNQSKLLGEWGVILGKLANGQIPDNTKVLTYTNESTGSRGYLYVKGGKFYQKSFNAAGKPSGLVSVGPDLGASLIKSGKLKTAIPQAVSDKPKAEGKPLTPEHIAAIMKDLSATNGEPLAVTASGDYIVYNGEADWFEHYTVTDTGAAVWKTSYDLGNLTKNDTWFLPDGKTSTPKATPAKTGSPTPPPSQVAAPVAATPVNAGSESAGSMSHEDVSAMFVKIKDDLAKEKGLNVKGANAELDALVHKAIGEKTGYTPAEVKAKIDAYKAAGNKLSALKKKVMSGKYKVPEGKAQPTKASPAAPLNVSVHTNNPASDPKPNGVPTVATPKLAEEIKADVKATVNKAPSKVYSDEDVAAAYIIAKDNIVATNTKGWTLYTKNDEFDLEIAIQVGLKTGLNPLQQKQAIANYLGSGKKLSVLKKQLIKQGAFEKKADTLKKSGEAKTLAEKAKEVNEKADAGYTPTPTPATGTPPVDTGKPAPKRVQKEAEESGDISGISPGFKQTIFSSFKDTGSQSWLSSGPASNYEGFAAVQAKLEASLGQKYTLLQLIRVVDEQGAKKAGVDNGKLFEKQVATWLTTPAGTQHIAAKKAELAKLAELEKKKAEAAKLAKELQDKQPPLPADSAQYQPWELDKAIRISRTWLADKPWTEREKRDLKHYTGSAYTEMNTYLRKNRTGGISERSKNAITGAMAGMRPTTEPILVRRGTGLNQFQSLGVGRGDKDIVWGITGKTFKNEGFLSTSAGGHAAFGGEARLEIECPVGTPMAYVAPISKYPSENEMLLQAGMEYKILNVRQEYGHIVVRMRVVNWPGKEG